MNVVVVVGQERPACVDLLSSQAFIHKVKLLWWEIRVEE